MIPLLYLRRFRELPYHQQYKFYVILARSPKTSWSFWVAENTVGIGISKVKHLQSGNDNFLTLEDFASKHDLRVCPLSFSLRNKRFQ